MISQEHVFIFKLIYIQSKSKTTRIQKYTYPIYIYRKKSAHTSTYAHIKNKGTHKRT